MAVCCCSLAGTAACQHCAQNPFATDVRTNKTVTVDHIDATPFGNGLDVCPVCGKPSTIGKPPTNADRIRQMSDYDLADWIANILTCHGAVSRSEEFDFDRYCLDCPLNKCCNDQPSDNIEDWLKAPAKEGEGWTD